MGGLPRRAAVAVANAPPVSGTVRRLAARDRGRTDQLAVLTYHRVDEPDDRLYPGLISATPATFAAQMAWLAKRHRVVSLAEVIARQAGGEVLPPRSVLLTFDDAYADFAAHAWPALREHGLAATLFVPTAYPGDPARAFWWDRLHRALMRAPAELVATPAGELDLRTAEGRSAAVRRLRVAMKELPHDDAMAQVDAVVEALGGDADGGSVLTWDALRCLVADGLTVGVHTRTHPLLDRLPTDRLEAEISGAREDLERELGVPVATIAYPNGNHSAAVLAAVADAGIGIGFTTRRGTNDLRHPSWLTLRRINVGRSTSASLLAAQLHRWFRFWP
jgi:peptidoglycan/xylan/chitin deacetylase (PgdA/CDA1 family)